MKIGIWLFLLALNSYSELDSQKSQIFVNFRRPYSIRHLGFEIFQNMISDRNSATLTFLRKFIYFINYSKILCPFRYLNIFLTAVQCFFSKIIQKLTEITHTQGGRVFVDKDNRLPITSLNGICVCKAKLSSFSYFFCSSLNNLAIRSVSVCFAVST